MSRFFPIASPMSTHADGTVALHLPCVVCGYDLIGLNRDARCPECGEPVVASLAPSPATLWGTATARNTRRGVMWLLWCHAALVAGGILGLIFAAAGLYVAIYIFAAMWPLLSLVGWWLIATPAERGLHRQRRLCWTIRVASVLYAAMLPLFFLGIELLNYRHPSVRLVFSLAVWSGLACGPVRFIAGMWLVRSRLPSRPDSGRGICITAIVTALAIPFVGVAMAIIPDGMGLLLLVLPVITFGATVAALYSLQKAMRRRRCDWRRTPSLAWNHDDRRHVKS